MSDRFDWLSDGESERIATWVREQNRRTEEELGRQPYFGRFLEALRAFSDRSENSSETRIRSHGGWLYALFTSSDHPRGVWRRTTSDSYIARRPRWKDLIDVDALSSEEGKPWMFQDQPAFYGSRVMIPLSLAGGFSISWREFDLEERRFVPGGFHLTESANRWVRWKDLNTLLVSDHQSRSIREWVRGTSFDRSKVILQVHDSGSVNLASYADEVGKRVFILSRQDAGGVASFLLDENDRLVPITVPHPIGIHRGEWLIWLHRSDWNAAGRTWKQGALVSVPVGQITDPAGPSTVREVTNFDARVPINGFQITSEGLLVVTYENVRARLWRYTFDGIAWHGNVIRIPDEGTLRLTGSVSLEEPTQVSFVLHESFLQPLTRYHVDVKAARATEIETAPARFDPACCVVRQLHATSRDGTRIPYFLVEPNAHSAVRENPTILEGYGFSGYIQAPHYDPALGKLWLERGGTYALANVRGGGEFGPEWHVTGKERAQTYEDILAVAQDLIERGVTKPKQLGISGYSNGGLLAAVALNMRPELFGAGVISHAVLDQFNPTIRPNHPEYGSRDIPEELAFLKSTSPYQNLRFDKSFPKVLILTSTTDENVRPGQSRKYAARLGALGMDYLYYETGEGGHGYGVTWNQRARSYAAIYSFFASQLMRQKQQ